MMQRFNNDLESICSKGLVTESRSRSQSDNEFKSLILNDALYKMV